MTTVDELMNAYDRAQTRLDVAILHPESSRYTVEQAQEMLRRVRAKVLKVMKGGRE
jgi:hypothetical protein